MNNPNLSETRSCVEPGGHTDTGTLDDNPVVAKLIDRCFGLGRKPGQADPPHVTEGVNGKRPEAVHNGAVPTIEVNPATLAASGTALAANTPPPPDPAVGSRAIEDVHLPDNP